MLVSTILVRVFLLLAADKRGGDGLVLRLRCVTSESCSAGLGWRPQTPEMSVLVAEIVIPRVRLEAGERRKELKAAVLIAQGRGRGRAD